MLDLDHFKSFNDAHGHAGGVRVLQIFSALVLECFRGEDIATRVGGEEFAVLLPRATKSEALVAVERFRCLLADSTMLLKDGQELTITVSIGLAVSRRPSTPLDELMKRADAGLYRAKREDRNRTVMASDDQSSNAT